MGLKEQLAEDLKTALRAKDTPRVNTIRLLRDAISKFEIAHTDPSNKHASQPITEADLLSVLEKQVKQRRESIEAYTQGKRLDLAEQEAQELDVLQVYLPKQLARAEIKSQVEEIIANLGTKEFPKVMRAAADQLKGRADGKVVHQVVKELTA